MPYGLYISAEGATAQSRRLEVLSNNLANVETAGFKRQLIGFQARFAEANARGLAAPGDGSVNDLGGGIAIRETTTDFSKGPVKHTKFPSDVAIDGDGFFAVQRGDQMMLTRAGNFSFTQGGVLVTQDGYPVLSDQGTQIIMDPDAGPWSITSQGAFVQAGEEQKIALQRPQSLGDLVPVSENLFKPLGKTLPVEDDLRQVKPGFLEQSGVKPTNEMMELIETSRCFEANTNMIKSQDQMIGNLLSRVLKES